MRRDGAMLAIFPPVDRAESHSQLSRKLFLSETPSFA
jgi:hypothetical protein